MASSRLLGLSFCALLAAAACSGSKAATTGPTSSSSAGGASSGGAAGGHGGIGGDHGGSGDHGGGGGQGGEAPAAGGAGGSGGGGSDCVVEGVPGDCIDVSACSATANHTSYPGYCPGAASIECCIPFGVLLCDPSEMPFPNDGDTTEDPGEGGCPAGMLPVSTYCVDRYEGTLVRVDDGTSWSPFFSPGDTPMRAVSVKGAVPQGYIDEIQANEACTNAGKRLCTNAEWLRACQGPDDDTYPYGDTDELGVCNDHRAVHPAIEYFGTSASWIWSELTNPCIDQIPDTVDRTGSLPGCVTAEGAFDMMGNLHEWTNDPAGTFRGGYYVDTVENGPGCLYATTAHDTLQWDYSTGFRCCADP